jgi:hypothetical protein
MIFLEHTIVQLSAILMETQKTLNATREPEQKNDFQLAIERAVGEFESEGRQISCI